MKASHGGPGNLESLANGHFCDSLRHSRSSCSYDHNVSPLLQLKEKGSTVSVFFACALKSI